MTGEVHAASGYTLEEEKKRKGKGGDMSREHAKGQFDFVWLPARAEGRRGGASYV